MRGNPLPGGGENGPPSPRFENGQKFEKRGGARFGGIVVVRRDAAWH